MMIDKKVKEIGIIVTRKCNMNCKYCYVPQSNKNIDSSSYDKIVEILLQSPGNEKVTNFIGGEPLLNIKCIKDIIKKIKEKNKQHNKKVQFRITTNGTIYNKNISEFIAKNKILLIISLDGAKKSHENARKIKTSQKSFDLIIKNIRMFQKDRNNICFNMTVSPSESQNLLKNYNYLKDLKITDKINISPAMGVAWTKEQIEKFNKDVKKLPNQPKIKKVQKIDLEKKCPLYQNLVIDADGSIYLCSFLLSKKEYRIGSLSEGIKRFTDCNYGKECRGCLEKYCNRLCTKVDFSKNARLNKEQTELLERFKEKEYSERVI